MMLGAGSSRGHMGVALWTPIVARQTRHRSRGQLTLLGCLWR